MPYVYRFIGTMPRTLDYRNAVVTLEIVHEDDPALRPLKAWTLRARKIGDKGAPCVLFSLPFSRQIFDHELARGFSVEARSPAAKLMDQLVRAGRAERVYHRG